MPVPIKSDRSARDVINYPGLHSTDLEGANRVYHLPEASLWQMVRWNGESWVAVDPTLSILGDVDMAGILDGQVLVYDAITGKMIPGTVEGGPSSGGGDLHWHIPGYITPVGNAGQAIIAGRNMTADEVILYVSDAGTAGETTVDVRKNGTSILSSDLTVPSNSLTKKSSLVPSVTPISKGDILTLDIEAAAAGAANISVVLVIHAEGVSGSGDMEKSIYDTDNDGVVDAAESVDWSGVQNKPTSYPSAWGDVSGKPTEFPPEAHTHPATAVNMQALMTVEGDLALATGKLALPNHTGRTLTISAVWLHVYTAPVGADVIIDIHKDGTTLFTNQANRPKITAGQAAGSATGLSLAWEDGKMLTLDIDQVGSGTAGAHLTVCIVYQ